MRLIDADTLNEYIEDEFEGVGCYDVSALGAVSDFQRMVYAQPTIEAIPVVHAEWIKSDLLFEADKCTNCNASIYNTSGMKFCPNCGARMKVGD